MKVMTQFPSLTNQQKEQVLQKVIEVIESIDPNNLEKLLCDMNIIRSNGPISSEYLVDKGVIHPTTFKLGDSPYCSLSNEDIDYASDSLYFDWKYETECSGDEDEEIVADPKFFVAGGLDTLLALIAQRELNNYEIVYKEDDANEPYRLISYERVRDNDHFFPIYA
jgi:hypothetical protein